ncbi:ABC transporter permease [Alloacidobacterium sp.]|uniref:ABC transporter permease n=1 Tax=Alloacidobacterium sp. TaxID=2951999 RepID=UPI002D23C056|nr:ABC transporter permease [Alloacidobacterium sp.]HYK38079.1 ABC transporter permease [Alloacidobacterium sp.]
MQIFQDLRYAVRQLRKNPGFALTAILTLALGIGATTAVFSVAYGVLIDPFPYKDVHTLATPKLCSSQWTRCGWDVYRPEQFNEIVQKTDIFSGVTASTISDVALTGGSEPQRLRGNYITPNTFDVLGVQPILGRASAESDVQPGHGEVALLSYRYWQAHFGGSPSVLGRVLDFNGHPRTIIGVMPPRFLWRGGNVYLPIEMTNSDEIQGQSYFTLVGRLKPGVTDAQASAELQPVFNDLARTEPQRFPKDLRIGGVMPFDQMFQSGLSSTLYLLLGSVAVLLLIACVNVSSLLLARAVNREHEFVVRSAIGATRLRLVRYALTESLLLALVAMPVALAFAYAGLQATLRIVPTETIPDEAVVTMNIPVLLVSIGIALLTVILFGLAPAWHSANPRLAAALSSVRSSGSRAQRRLLSGFVVTEIALSLALLTLAGLMVRSLIAVESIPLPFSPDHTLTMRIPLTEQRYPTPESHIRFYRELLSRVTAIPGIRAASPDSNTPFLGIWGAQVQVPGKPEDKRIVALHLVSPEYLAMSARHLTQGHFIDDREIADKAHEAVVTEDFVKRYFNGENVLGRVVHLPELKSDKQFGLNDDAFTIVGVVNNMPLFTISRVLPHIFLPYSVFPLMDTLLISTDMPAANLANPVRKAVYSIDKDQPVTDLFTLRQLLDMYGYASPRFALALFGTFAAAALLLSLVGVYGVLSFVTSQRTQEIGIRMALGANRGNVMWMVLRQACMLALLGVAIGLPLAFFAGRFAKDELIRTSQHDPVTLIIAICILPLLAVAGTLLPARRAAAIDPAKALRAE